MLAYDTLLTGIVIATAGLSVFIALSNAMQERRYDLAVMRTLGARPATLMGLMLFEGLLLAALGVTTAAVVMMALSR